MTTSLELVAKGSDKLPIGIEYEDGGMILVVMNFKTVVTFADH